MLHAASFYPASVPSEIQIEAFKKLILCRLLLFGRFEIGSSSDERTITGAESEVPLSEELPAELNESIVDASEIPTGALSSFQSCRGPGHEGAWKITPSVARSLRSSAAPYLNFAELFTESLGRPRAVTAVRKAIDGMSGLLKKDGNYGLALMCANSLSKHLLTAMTRVYSRVSLEDLASMIGLSSGRQAMSLLEAMVRSGSLD